MGHMINGVIAIDEGLGKCLMEAGGGGASVFKYKKRRISAVRDFPPGCGRNAARVNGNSKENHAAPGDAVNSLTDAQKEFVGNTSGAVGGLDQCDSPYLSQALLDEINKEAEDSAGVEEKELVDTPDKAVSDTSSLQSPVESVLPKKPAEEESGYLHSPVIVDAAPVIAPKKIFPRRNVSAFREFPPGCGRNAAPVNLKALRKSVESSKIMGLGQGSPSEDDNAKQNVESDAEQGDGKVLAGDSQVSTTKEKKFEDRLQLKSKEMVKKQRVEQVYHKKAGMKHPRDSSGSLSESLITKKVDRVIGSSGGNSDMGTLKFSKDMSYKRNFPGKPMNETPCVSQSQVKPHVDSFEDREVVQSIMAKRNCPWVLGRKSFTPSSSDRLQVDQGKKTFKSVAGNVSQSELGKKVFKTPDSRGSQSEQGKKIVKPSTASQSGASVSHNSQLDGREIVLSLASARYCPWRSGKKPIKSSGGQAKQR